MRSGLHVSDLTAAQKRELKVGRGRPGRVRRRTRRLGRHPPGDVILQMNNVELTSAAQFNGLVAKLDPKKPVALLVRRDNVSQYLVIRPRQ